MSSSSTREHERSQVLAAEDINRSLRRISHEILERNASSLENLALVGVLTRGVPLARRISGNLRQFEGLDVPVGSLDITLFTGTTSRTWSRRFTAVTFPST